MVNQNFLTQELTGPCPLGAGAMKARPGAYQIALDWDGRYGIPGPREVADIGGIAQGYVVMQMLKHADTLFAITTDGTNTKVYRKEAGAWALKATINTRVPYGPQSAISFKNVLAIGFVGGNPYQYSTDTGGGAYSFTASTKTSVNSKQSWMFLLQSNGLLSPRVCYMVSNEFYYTEDLTNTDGTGVNPEYIGDTATTQNVAVSLAEEPGTGRVLIGMRHALYTVHTEPGYDGVVEKLTEDFPDTVADAGSTSDRTNFENPVLAAGVLWYPVAGYDLLCWRGSGANPPYSRYMAPRWSSDCQLPRADLPINCVTTAGGGAFLILFIGSKNTSTLKDVTYFPGGNAHIAAQFTAHSDMWVGVPTDNGIVWHGVLLQCSKMLRYAYWDEDDQYLYMANGDAEISDPEMVRCLFTIDNPLHRLTSSAVVLNNSTWKVEYGAIDFGDEWTSKKLHDIRVEALGLASSTPSLEVEYKVTPDDDTNAFESAFATFTSVPAARMGELFPDETIGRKLHLRLVGTGTSNSYPLVKKLIVRAQPEDGMDRPPRRR